MRAVLLTAVFVNSIIGYYLMSCCCVLRYYYIEPLCGYLATCCIHDLAE